MLDAFDPVTALYTFAAVATFAALSCLAAFLAGYAGDSAGRTLSRE